MGQVVLTARCLLSRQLNRKLRALSPLALRPDGTAMRLNNGKGDRQPQARAARVHRFEDARVAGWSASRGNKLIGGAAAARLVRSIEALEDMRQILRPNALAVVRDLKLRHVLGPA